MRPSPRPVADESASSPTAPSAVPGRDDASPIPETPIPRPTGKKASNPGALASQLVAQGLPDSGETRSFASDLLSRLPRGGGAGTRPVSQHKRDEREAAAIAARNRTYTMLEDDDEPAPAPAPAPASAKASKDERRRAKRACVARAATTATRTKPPSPLASAPSEAAPGYPRR